MEPKTVEIRSNGHTFLTVDDRGVTIRRQGMLNALNQGFKGAKTIPYASITAVQLKKPGMTAGYIQFTILGGRESPGGVLAATKDENTVLFSGRDHYAEMLAIKALIEAKIQDYSRPRPSVQAAPDSNLDQIAKLKALLDSGAITQEEFTAKKHQLLDL
ncbi:SHOCT domain-containing protein [Lacticaseibacillus kribbianus]|uniref:SHOCT domain-containing protein n=1 Tax=Lacticaseibacillus kribbianus TaxID=2926292 RepID=UPI001CD7C48A|nr:SHOCT domain-containing protein [Lacticaseibacillus kribbianus]